MDEGPDRVLSVLVPVIKRVSGGRRIMGDYVNGNAASILGWLTAALIGAQARRLPQRSAAPAELG